MRNKAFNYTIASGTSADGIDLDGFTFSGFIVPAAAASIAITFKVSMDGTNYFTLKDSSNAAISLTIAADGAYTVNPNDFAGYKYIQPILGSSETSKTFTLVGVLAANRG